MPTHAGATDSKGASRGLPVTTAASRVLLPDSVPTLEARLGSSSASFSEVGSPHFPAFVGALKDNQDLARVSRRDPNWVPLASSAQQSSPVQMEEDSDNPQE